MFYAHSVPSGISQLKLAIERELQDRNDTAIKAKLLFLLTQIKEKPRAFPACVSTGLNKKFYKELAPIADISDKGANFIGDPMSTSGLSGGSAYVASKTGPATAGRIVGGAAYGGMVASLLNFFSGKSKDYYEFYMKRISDELALRGIPASSL